MDLLWYRNRNIYIVVYVLFIADGRYIGTFPWNISHECLSDWWYAFQCGRWCTYLFCILFAFRRATASLFDQLLCAVIHVYGSWNSYAGCDGEFVFYSANQDEVDGVGISSRALV